VLRALGKAPVSSSAPTVVHYTTGAMLTWSGKRACMQNRTVVFENAIPDLSLLHTHPAALGRRRCMATDLPYATPES
jgi:hypothetical protein